MTMLGLASVVAVHPGRRTLELVDQNNGTRMAEVQYAGGPMSSDTGSWDIPDVPRPATEQQAGGPNASGRSMTAVYAMIYDRPVILGFLPPTASPEVAFGEQNRSIHRHSSGAYATIAPDGSIDIRHPGGAGVRIGTGDSENIGAGAANGWNPPSASPPQITVNTSGFILKIEPGGKVTLEGDSTADLTFAGLVTLEAPNVLIKSNVAIQGNLSVTGIGGGGPSAVTMTGTIALTGSMASTGDIVAGGISQIGHHHTLVEPGSGNSGPPA